MTQRVLITCPRTRAAAFAEALRRAGFDPIDLPIIETSAVVPDPELVHALTHLNEYDWLVFTSIEGVNVFWEALNKQGDGRIPDSVRVAAIGPQTAQALKTRGVYPAFVPKAYVVEAILAGLGDLRGQRVLLPRSDIARQALPDAIVAAGGLVHEIAVYCTLPVLPNPADLAELCAGVDWITFTSPSAVHHFARMLVACGLDPWRLPHEPHIACIGPVTAQTARIRGYNVAVVAEEYTTDGLTRAILDFMSGGSYA